MLGRSLKKSNPEAATPREEKQQDVRGAQEFSHACLDGILKWAQNYHAVMSQLNSKKIPCDLPLSIEEINFRIATAINTKIFNFLMGPDISMIQNSIAVVAAMVRGRFHEANPSLLAYLESAHDMLRRLDPTLWTNFDDVVRYVLPLRVKVMAGWDNVHEISSILNKKRTPVTGRDIFPLSYEQVGYIMDLLRQEDVEAAQSQVIKLVNNAANVRSQDARVLPIRLALPGPVFLQRLEKLNPIDLLSIVLGFRLAGVMEDRFIPRPQDERMNVESLHFLLGEGCFFPLNDTPIVQVPSDLVHQSAQRASQLKPAAQPSVQYADSKTLYKKNEDGSLSHGLSSSGDDISTLLQAPAAVRRSQGQSGRGDFSRAVAESNVSFSSHGQRK